MSKSILLILKMLLWSDRIKDNKILLNIEIDSEFLMFTSKLSQSFWEHGKLKLKLKIKTKINDLRIKIKILYII